MDIQPPEEARPVHLDRIVPGSASVVQSPYEPNKLILKAQVIMAPVPDAITVMLHLDQAEAASLMAGLKARLTGTCH